MAWQCNSTIISPAKIYARLPLFLFCFLFVLLHVIILSYTISYKLKENKIKTLSALFNVKIVLKRH